MDIKEVQNLIKFVAKSGVSEVKIENKDFKLTIKNKPEIVAAPLAAAPVPVPAAPVAVPQETQAPATIQPTRKRRRFKICYHKSSHYRYFLPQTGSG